MAFLIHVQEKTLKTQNRSLQTNPYLITANSLLTSFQWGSLVTSFNSMNNKLGGSSMSLETPLSFLQIRTDACL